MKDDNMQGILFSKSELLRFRQLPMPPKGLLAKSKNKTKKRLLEPLAFMRRRHNKNLENDTEIGDYIDYVVKE